MSPEEMYRLHKHRVYRLCLRFCGGQVALAEDLTQDVFIKMLERMDDLSSLDALEPWLYRVTTNVCFSRLKRDTSIWHKVRTALSMQPSPVPITPEHHLQLREDLHEVMEALQELPAQERIVFCMHTMDELPQHEICDILSLSKGYVSKLLQRSRQQLMRVMGGCTDV